MKSITMPLTGAKLVHVSAYTRFRYGKTEWVTTHFRSHPGS